MDSNQIVYDVLSRSKQPMKGGEIAEAAGIDKKEVDKAIKKLKSDGKITSPKNCYYQVV